MDDNNLILLDDETGGETEPTEPEKPKEWKWSNKVLSALKNHGSVTTITVSLWNDLVERTQEMLVYNNLNNAEIGENPYGFRKNMTYSELLAKAQMSTTDKTIRASKFNYLRYCIGSVKSTGLKDYEPGDIIEGEFFIKLTTALNKAMGY